MSGTALRSRRDREMAASLAIDPTALEVGAERNLVHPGARGERGFPVCDEPGCRRESIGPFAYRCVSHYGVLTLARLDAVLDAWLDVRVAAHSARGDAEATVRAIDVQLYLHALRVVREAERVLEPLRQELGADGSRAYELVTTDEQLALEVAA